MNDMSLKAKLRNISVEKNVSAQSVFQNYLLNRFLLRLSKSEYKDKFVVKGGILITSIIGIDHRATMDLDTTLRNLPLTKQSIESAFNSICNTKTDDDIEFELTKIRPIRNDDLYGGYRVTFLAKFGKINSVLSMDVSTGDIITPGAELHTFQDLIDENITFELWSYTIETVLAEKIETILSRETDNTRPRDFYDVYMLSSSKIDLNVLHDAFIATTEHRMNFSRNADYKKILEKIKEDPEMTARWTSYTNMMPYASGISFDNTINVIQRLLEQIT